MDDIQLIENDALTLWNVTAWLENCFAVKHFGEATYTLKVKSINIDVSESLYSARVCTILKTFKMKNSNKRVCAYKAW